MHAVTALEVVLVGAGNRGRHTFARFASREPERLRVVAVAESRDDRRAAIATELGLPRERCFRDWRALLEQPQLGPAAIIATPDTEHVAPALAALEAGYDVLLEKPIAPDPAAPTLTAAKRCNYATGPPSIAGVSPPLHVLHCVYLK